MLVRRGDVGCVLVRRGGDVGCVLVRRGDVGCW